MNETTKTIAYYRQLPYTRRVRRVQEDNGESYFVACIEELGGVEADGDTPTDALANLADAFQDYITAMLEWREMIPEPKVWPASLGWESAVGRPTATVDIAGFEPNVATSAVPPKWIAVVPEVATARSMAMA
jgi:predicted RNase H-like HicB family nuclease